MTNKRGAPDELTQEDIEKAIAEVRYVMEQPPPDMDILDLTEEVEDKEHIGGEKRAAMEHPGLTSLRNQRAELHKALHSGKNEKHEDALNKIPEAHKKKVAAKEPDYTFDMEALLEVDTAQQTQHSLRQLMQAAHPTKHQTVESMPNGTTITELVTELLRPQLSNWLNKNLPQLVQSVVEKEIRKLIQHDDA